MKTRITLLSLLIFVTMSGALFAYEEDSLKQLLETNSCEHCNLRGADLRKLDLTNVFLSGSNLSGANFSDSNLAGADLTDTYLYQTNFVRTKLTKANFFGSRMTGADLTSASLDGANIFLGEISQVAPVPSRMPLRKTNGFLLRDEGAYGKITSFDLSQPVKYMTSKSGLLYRSKGDRYEAYVRNSPDLLAAFEKNKLGIPMGEWGKRHWEKSGQHNPSRYLPTLPEFEIVLDLNENPHFIKIGEVGLFSVVTQDNLIYLSYTIRGECSDNASCRDKMFLVVDEYNESMEKIRTIIKIKTRSWNHVAGTLAFDLFGKLYLSVGEGRISDYAPQDIDTLVGKILRLDTSEKYSEPEVIAYGLRNPWKFSIDSKNRMFIGDCGEATIESVYLLDDLYPARPYNLGWPVFEGSKRFSPQSLNLRFEDTLAPIYEYRHHQKPACVIGGYFINELNAYLHGDYTGKVRLLKKLEEHWQEIYFQMTPGVLSFGMNTNNNNIYIGSWNKVYRLVPLKEEIKRYPSIVLCDTTMPDGMLNNRDCD